MGIVRALVARPRATATVALLVACAGVALAGLRGSLPEAGSAGSLLVVAGVVLVICITLAIEVFRAGAGSGTDDERPERAARYLVAHPAFALSAAVALVVLVLALVGLALGFTGLGLSAAAGGAMVGSVFGLAGLRNALTRS